MDSAVLCWMLGVMTGLAIGVACEAIAGARERRRQREVMADAEAAAYAELTAYAEGLHDGRRRLTTSTQAGTPTDPTR